MICQAARQLEDGQVVFVGIGLPNLACNLARRLHAPDLVLLYESGAVGATPERLPVSIGDPSLVTNSLSVCSMFEVFNYYLQGGRIDVGFLQGAQIDRFGNLNTTVVGDYARPKVRLPGSGGACEISILAGKVLIVATQTKRTFPERVDFITSPGFLDGPGRRQELGLPGGGPAMVITDLGCYTFENDEMMLASLHPGCTVEQVRQNLGWEVKVAPTLARTEPPTAEELHLIRDELTLGASR
ncbi:MAG: CoA-transferase subunit beta [Deltaproteobacteria bacterium]|nr:CoA-transferase subunit beta [Deltaproteobacteria bacterium]